MKQQEGLCHKRYDENFFYYKKVKKSWSSSVLWFYYYLLHNPTSYSQSSNSFLSFFFFITMELGFPTIVRWIENPIYNTSGYDNQNQWSFTTTLEIPSIRKDTFFMGVYITTVKKSNLFIHSFCPFYTLILHNINTCFQTEIVTQKGRVESLETILNYTDIPLFISKKPLYISITLIS